ncbi:unnamed protein product [Didymodactylos carnosus]|uniref:Cyclase n=1 Tax=Didymodactylos carnosus TaxID=1234261 RepID=A0A815PV28_9BILA|nr:unnamed protein product [Didymodactylos carnosus]CAF1453990.1 unnamed protein product [Didymodactylos carnosus]CAF4133513.1 unnamed protein product [Didymodactylos carnosus]CAF4326496.1 unnamed protein product [Didymodactylos carnosus]
MSLLSSSRVMDLTHIITEDMPTWDEGIGFTQEQTHFLDVHGYSIHQLNFKKAGLGTHFDSAAHFFDGKRWVRTVHEYPVAELISPAVVINVSQQTERNKDYQITQQDIINWEKVHGSIQSGSFVIANTGWSKYWNDPVKFLGFDENKIRHFPGWGEESAQYLLDKGVRGLGIDAVSIDAGNNINFDAHRVFLKADKYLVENINIGTETNNTLPDIGATVFVLPIPIKNCSEAPARVIAYV